MDTKEVILDLSEHSSGDEVNVEGLSDILQEDIQINDNSDDKSENLHGAGRKGKRHQHF